MWKAQSNYINTAFFLYAHFISSNVGIPRLLISHQLMSPRRKIPDELPRLLPKNIYRHSPNLEYHIEEADFDLNTVREMTLGYDYYALK